MNNVAKYFDEEVAKDIGTDSAIILQNIEFWQQKNQANNKNFYDGRYCTYNSVSAYEELFSWLSVKQIRTCLSKLENSGYLVVGNYNKSSYDRTKWYSSVRVKSNLQDGKLHLPKSANQIDQMGEPIPYNNTDNNSDSKTDNNIEETSSSSRESSSSDESDKSNHLKDRKKKKEKSSAKKEKVFSTQVEYVYAQAIEHFTDYLRPKTKSAENDWKDEIRKLNELDKRPFTEILEVIKWVRNDPFWSSNCLTMLKPRKKDKSGVMYYNVFLTKMKSESGKTSQENKQQQRIMDLAEKVRLGAEMAKQKLI